jgi:serine/threonine protein kinase
MSNNNRIKELKQKIKNNPLSRSVPVLHDFSDEDKRSGHNTPDALLESEEDLEERSLEDVSGSPANKFKYKKVRSASEILSMTEEVLSQKLETTESECVAWIDKVLEICAETSLKPLLQELRTRITSHQQCSELIQQLHLQQQALTQQNLKLMITRLLLILGQLTRTKELMDLNKENMKQNANSPSPRRVPLRRADSSYENSLEQPRDHKGKKDDKNVFSSFINLMRGAFGFGKHKRGDKHDKHGPVGTSSEEVSSAEHSPRDKNVTFHAPSSDNTPSSMPSTPKSNDMPVSSQSTPGRLDKPHLKLILPRQEQIKAEDRLETRARSASEPQGRDEDKEQLPMRNSQDMPRGQTSNGQILLLCRICENVVPSDQLAKHSEYCLLANQYDVRLSSCDARLDKLTSSISKIIKSDEKKKGRSKKELEIMENLVKLAQKARSTRIMDRETTAALQKEAIDLRHAISKNLASSKARSVAMERWAKEIESLIVNKSMMFNKRKSLPISADSPRRKETRKDFKILKPIAKGAFGKVYLARKKKTGDLYAVKALRKKDMIRKKQVDRIKSERNIMISTTAESKSSSENPFVVNLYYTFQSKRHLYMVMEYMPGGDLYSLLKAMSYFEEDMAKFYMAEIVLAVEYLHSRHITHRDLKPDNLLVGRDGHTKLTDFGLSRFGLLDKPFLTDQPPLTSPEGDWIGDGEPHSQGQPFHRPKLTRSMTAPSHPLNPVMLSQTQQIPAPSPMGQSTLNVPSGQQLKAKNSRNSRTTASYKDLPPSSRHVQRIGSRDSLNSDDFGSAERMWIGRSYTGDQSLTSSVKSDASSSDITDLRAGSDPEIKISHGRKEEDKSESTDGDDIDHLLSQSVGSLPHHPQPRRGSELNKSGPGMPLTPTSISPDMMMLRSSLNNSYSSLTNTARGGSKLVYRRYSFVGTPDYLAPEVILGTGHSFSVDWWALGVILFEFLTGIPPFNAETEQQIYENIINRRIPWEYLPDEVSQEARDLIDRLLCLSTEDRLGAKGATEVKAHPFFKGVDWKNVSKENPPFKPNLDDDEDTSYFDDERIQDEKWTMTLSMSSTSDSNDDESGSDDVEGEQELSSFDNKAFQNFSFINLPQLGELNKRVLSTPTNTPRDSPRRRGSDADQTSFSEESSARGNHTPTAAPKIKVTGANDSDVNSTEKKDKEKKKDKSKEKKDKDKKKG